MTQRPVPAFPAASRVLLVASMTALFVIVAAIMIYPLFAGSVFERHSPRTLGLVLLIASGISLALPERPPRLGVRIGRWPGVGMALLGGAAVLFDERLPLLLAPSFAYGVVAAVFWGSRTADSSLVDRFVKLIHPYKPDFVGAYCHKLTSVLGWFFAGHGAALALLAVAAPVGWWEAYTGWVLMPTMLLFSVVEYLIRKTTFRYYPYGSPIDRVFAAWFPAENTAMGRRSQAYIEARAQQLASDSAAKS